jgi:hypothetical protein
MKPVLLLLFALLALPGRNRAEDPQGFRFVAREVPWGEPIRMEEFGGPPVEIAVRSRQIHFVSVEIADYTRMVPVLVNDATIYGPSRVVMQPTRQTRRVEKKNGARAPGGRSDMYLLYVEPESGVQVYFSDETVGQNRDKLLIAVPSGANVPPRVAFRPPAPASLNAAPAGKPDGYLSDKLLDWYLRITAKRDRLDLNDSEAVLRFNEEAARYHEEVKRERARISGR